MVSQLENILNLAKEGKIVSCVLVCVDNSGQPLISMSNTSIHSPDRLVGLLERLKFSILSAHDNEYVEDIDPEGNNVS